MRTGAKQVHGLVQKCYAITERMPDLGEILREVNTGLSDIHRASLKQHLGRTEPGHK